ncbi:polysaccharide deacetylase family protein [Oceanobacillus halotolerans]|uniref:polysaccharide deacetylase family protein n=1 Tax=Oceanobacillus halotolerans TaxID=2663380 RepID=UPI0013DAD0E6|nr:polysaccharide deacetylase family protein [Oceanobacillus halotolerans]
MYRYGKYIHMIVFAFVVLITFNYDYNPFELNERMDDFQFTEGVAKTEDPLYIEISEKSYDYTEPPQDAVIDEVWKKMPGLNGLEVDIDKSYKQMKKEKTFNESLLVFNEIPPDVTLKDLPAAPIYRGHPEKDMVSFLINVSWGGEHIPHILNVLKKHDVKAAFFIEGKWAKENSDYVKMIDEQNHVIGNHAYNHPNMERLSKQEVREQLTQTNEIIKAIIGETPKWFAPPSGNYNDQVVDVAYDLKMETILWSVDTIDWKNPSVSVMINRINNKIHPGAMVLMHPTSSIAQGLEEIIVTIQDKGYRIGPIDKLLSEER